ncbi:MAG: OmpA family protein [Rhizobacter sp.]
MNVQDDGVQGYALGAVFGVVGLLVAGVIALACFHIRHVPPVSVTAQRVSFEADGTTLSPEATELLVQVADAARDNARIVFITGIQSSRGDGLAAQRGAERVRHALEANGVPPAQLTVLQPHFAVRANDRLSVELRWGEQPP